MVKLNILHVKTSHGFVDESDVNIFRGCGNPSEFFGLKLKLTVHFIGFLKYAHRRTTNLIPDSHQQNMFS